MAKINRTLGVKSDFSELDDLIDSHQACENNFFGRARERQWSYKQLLAFAPDYYYWVMSFPGILAELIGNVRDQDSQFFLTQILFSELGSGSKKRMHFKLLRDILQQLGLSESQIESGPNYQETKILVEGMRHLYRHQDILQAMGAQYALEKQAFPMIEKLYDGFKHYNKLTKEDFEYFELHLVEEPEHLECMQQCMVNYMNSLSDLSQIKTGAIECLSLIANFWRRQFKEVSALERIE